MATEPLLTRRMMLRDMGKAGLAIMVFGTAACAEDPTGNATPTAESGATTTAAPPPASTTSTNLTTSTSEPPTGHEWHRADLGIVSAYILYRNGEAALVDTGVGGSEGDIEAALGEVELDWDDVGHLIVTHRHPDHQGSVEAILATSQAPWYAGEGDIGEITASTEGIPVGDGDSVFDLQIIETPGHTPGHISVFDPVAGILVTGDALNGANGGVAGPSPDFSEDIDAANASVAKLAGLDFEIALFGHGEPVVESASEQVAELADSLNGG